jgi:hypothetical protein
VTFRDENLEGNHHRNIKGDAESTVLTDPHQRAYSAYTNQGSEVGLKSLAQAATKNQES